MRKNVLSQFGAALLLCTTMVLAAQDAPKFRPAPSSTGHYEATIAVYPGDDVEALARQLVATYRGVLESDRVTADGRFRFAATGDAAALLSSDNRVILVQEVDRPASLHPQTDDTGVVWSAGPYAHDGTGNVKSIGPGETFVYDMFGRLKSGTAGANRLQEYTYDAYGNVLNVTTDLSTSTALKPCVDAATNQIDRVGTDCNALGTYSSAGNMESYGSYATFVYDEVDMVKESTVDSARKVYLYTASDERIAAIAIVGGAQGSSEWTIRDNADRTLRRFSRTAGGVWSWTEDYVYRDGALLAAEVPGPERTLHFHVDHLGTPRLITGSGGAEISRHTYYPFGQEATSATQDAERAKFTGHERDDQNIDYMHARYYMPFTGRFISVDPGRDWNSAQPQSWNLYTYARNNPLLFTDPDGKAILLWSKKKGLRFGSDADDDGEADELQGDPNGSGNGIFGSLSIVNVKAIDKVMMQALAYYNDTAINLLLSATPIKVPAGGFVLKSAAGGQVLPMAIVRILPKGTAAGILNEAKALTFSTGLEHAVVRLATGERALVAGGAGGIAFAKGQVTRIIGHTHPYGMGAAGPSAADRAALRVLRQIHSYVVESGQIFRFGGL